MNESKLSYENRFQNQMNNLLKALSKSLLYLQVRNVNLTLFRTLEILDHSFKLKTI